MCYLCMIKSSECSAPGCVMQRIPLTRDKTQITSIHDLQCLCQERNILLKHIASGKGLNAI